jgi:acetyl esterase/lipase
MRIYVPEGDMSGRPMLVWMHGGARVWGGLDDSEADSTSREVAVRGDAVIVSVDYRLATDGVRYPAPLDDVIAAYRWARDNADSLGADSKRITLGGASAGGNLAAGAALRLPDKGDPLPVALALAYPALHPQYLEPSEELAAALARMNPFASDSRPMRLMAENYAGGPVEQSPAYATPALADDLSGMPRTYIFNDEFDAIRASGERTATHSGGRGRGGRGDGWRRRARAPLATRSRAIRAVS